MQQRIIVSLFLATLAAGAGGCGTPRTAAATQTSVAAFDPSMSDAKALEAVDAMMAALGGVEKWNQVKQIRWDVKYTLNGELKGMFRHSWDIWNGRHRYEFAGPEALAAEERVFTYAMYDLFDRSKGYVANSKHPNQKAPAEQAQQIISAAYDAWKRDSYQLSMFFKLRDPGVKLSYAGERQDFMGVCKPACADIKVSFAPEVGADTYHVLINTESKLPEAVEKAIPNGRLGYRIMNWVEVNGLKFPTVYKNLGAEEKFELENVRIGEPEDDLYVPQVVG